MQLSYWYQLFGCLEPQTRVAEIDASIGDFVAVKMVRIASGLSNCHSGASITQNAAIGGHYHRFMKPSLPSAIGITREHRQSGSRLYIFISVLLGCFILGTLEIS
jgi:hypothetical protein